jgi:hypothetical protein
MTRQNLVELIHRNPLQDSLELKEYLKTLSIKDCDKELPKKTGEYLVYHIVYGWCLFGFVVGHNWGGDDLVETKTGHYRRVRHWAELILEEENEKDASRNI